MVQGRSDTRRSTPFTRKVTWSFGVKPASGLCCIARPLNVGVAVSKDLAPGLVPGEGLRMAEIHGTHKVSGKETAGLKERRGDRQPDGDDRCAGKAQEEAGMHHPREADVARAEHKRVGKGGDGKHEGS